MPEIKTILWDWNGTLLNDVDHCIRCMNLLLEARRLTLLEKERYLDVFTFPVKEYYTLLGFDFHKEPFEIPAEEFIVHYNKGLEEVPLHDDVTETLAFISKKGIDQYIVSAMQHDALLASVTIRKIADYFRQINGIEDNLAFGKTAIAREIIKVHDLDPQHTLLVGDTLHDAEVADASGVECVLIARGHQHKVRLAAAGKPVYSSLKEWATTLR
ncbi:MAG: HAD family hydrolase [Bacteroidota bacterium]